MTVSRKQIDLEDRDRAARRGGAADAPEVAADAELEAPRCAADHHRVEREATVVGAGAPAPPTRTDVEREPPLAAREAARSRCARTRSRSVPSEKYVVVRRSPPTTTLLVGVVPTPMEKESAAARS